MAEEVNAFEPQIEFFIAKREKHPIGILADLTEMQGAEWKAPWNEMRFLQKFSDHIARMAVVGA
ncbi:MAG: STAS/SEC14 domain-containing protein, partial [Candidatus Korobacteraceae bacterium]